MGNSCGCEEQILAPPPTPMHSATRPQTTLSGHDEVDQIVVSAASMRIPSPPLASPLQLHNTIDAAELANSDPKRHDGVLAASNRHDSGAIAWQGRLFPVIGHPSGRRLEIGEEEQQHHHNEVVTPRHAAFGPQQHCRQDNGVAQATDCLMENVDASPAVVARSPLTACSRRRQRSRSHQGSNNSNKQPTSATTHYMNGQGFRSVLVRAEGAATSVVPQHTGDSCNGNLLDAGKEFYRGLPELMLMSASAVTGPANTTTSSTRQAKGTCGSTSDAICAQALCTSNLLFVRSPLLSAVAGSLQRGAPSTLSQSSAVGMQTPGSSVVRTMASGSSVESQGGFMMPLLADAFGV
jgi:hypothetical protein